ncbi:MAG: YbjN domain-containing protein [candidate division KSB1 bacterium]|nr:YbjN domain-containing protein [candidate division KSB1 bacterium]MDZ7275387.1 YbjN domain-containing protein [candidate division KSB1 bacterium]MDZ7286300.1 YbjN domain-containing protein [candidate division KSB1 bacterium]MDZ7296527.1 YbjN domain-containing protein [candidate division KSB1 bacterium]MDZ7347393.1 YbjN domain-containing protein [candidate division KSB1 bacterium]
MPNDLVTPENLSTELLKSMFDAAFMETSIDEDGDLQVRDGIGCYVFAREDRIRLMTLFRSKEGASRQELLEFANRVNDEYVIVRVTISNKGTVSFDYDIPVKGGITKQAVVLATKRFLSIPINAIAEYGSTLIR